MDGSYGREKRRIWAWLSGVVLAASLLAGCGSSAGLGYAEKLDNVYASSDEGPQNRQDKKEEGEKVRKEEDLFQASFTDAKGNRSVQSYRSSEEFLHKNGFQDVPPSAEFRDENGNLLVELYLREDGEMGCGIWHTMWALPNVSMKGFVFQESGVELWDYYQEHYIVVTNHQQDVIIDGRKQYFYLYGEDGIPIGRLSLQEKSNEEHQGYVVSEFTHYIIATDLFDYSVHDENVTITGIREEYEELLWDYMGKRGCLEIPDTIEGLPVTKIGESAFENMEIEKVRLPKYVEIIDNNAFRNTGVISCDFARCYDLKKLGDGAFENCHLQNNDYSALGMEEIGERAFAGNPELTQVNFIQGDVRIGKDAFADCGEEMTLYVGRSKAETGGQVENYATEYGYQVIYAVGTQIHVPSEPYLLTPEIGSFFYGELGGTYDDWGEDKWCTFEEAEDAPNFGFRDWQWIGCSKWCHIADFTHQMEASSELPSATGRYQADNVISENRGFAWVEGVEGAGIGEYLVYDQIVLSQSLIERSGNKIYRAGDCCDDGYIDYTQICIVNGYARDEQVWQENGRVKTLLLYVEDQPYAYLALQDTMNPQYFTLPQEDIKVANGEEVTFKFEIEEVYPGTMYEDTCLTGVVVDFGNVPDWH